ncbi:unnamed protein product [Triticum turgidum subsp. durum]|uniref:SWIM-type domain-containing protein n=1 Tax=Triticum turgidum subsp. durum TaxID=4567 RepID=A0A9R1QYG5_TRITD|nr:unnamed protein product [Triticum turgidum subsp. durum]
MRFDSWEAGLAFYRMYAHEVGFSVRVWTQHKGEGGVIIWKKFVCARQGWRKRKSVDLGQVTQEVGRKKAKRNIKISRCGCKAMMGLKRQDDNKYEVVQFVQSHTHQLVSPSKRHLIRSNREVTSDLRNKLFTCSKALLGTSKTFRLLSIEKGGPENIGCTKHDLQNCQRDFKAAIKGADGQLIVDIMENKKKANPAFYFDYQVDENNKLTNIFWADSICRKNYSLFGDVVSFDSTYRFNKYDLVFAPFTGVNHHKSCVTFGAAFLSNEKIASYKWLFQTFLKAMCGVAPKLVITDEDQSMRRGIESIFPNTKHRLCMWHILMKLPEKVGPILRDNEDFKPRFMACVRGSETPDEFESRWSSIISEFGLEDNEWLKEKYGLRESWIPAYFMEFSLGGILRTTSRSESENAFFRHFTNRKLTLIEFWVRFETALEEQRQKELQEDNCALHTLPVLETCWGIEAHAREVYTHNIFVAFQREVVAARDRRHVKTIERVGDVRTMSIGDLSGRIITVCFNTNTKAAQCTCRMFESLGILCSHIIVVLKNDGCNEIPSQYVLHRWTKMAARHLCYDANGHEMEGSSTSLSPIIKKLYSQTWSRFSLALHEARHCEDKMEYLNKVVADALAHLRQTAPLDEQSKVQEFESFIGTTFPSIINIHPPDIANTKGSGKRLKRGSEEAINKRKKVNKP